LEATGRSPRTVQFGAFKADLAAAQLYKHGHRIKLQQQPFQVLAMFLERPGEVVTRDELQKRLWPADTFVDFDHGVNIAINKLREALGDSAEEPRFIETLPRLGYRFISPIEQGHSPPDNAPTEVARPARRLSHTLAAALAGTIVLAAVIGLNLGGWRERVRGRATPRIESLAVLPFANLSGDPEQEYFADGMTEALINDLAKISALKVISRTSAMQFKQTSKRLPQIAWELGVDAVMEGSVQREGDQVRISIQLIDAATDKHLWADQYQRDYRSILALQSEVARAIAQHIEITLTAQEQVRLGGARMVDPGAHEAYLKGRYYSNKRTAKELKKSLEYFQQAIEKDPSYAPAYSGMADAYALLGYRGDLSSKEALSRAKAAALKAVELDETLAEAHASLAFIAETHEWDWSFAEREYKRALDLNPGYAAAHNWYAGYLMYLGRFDEGIAEAKRARELDPLSLAINNALGGRLLLAGRDKEAVEQIQKTLEMDPNFAPAHNRLGWAHLRSGKYEQAVAEFQQARALSESDPDFLVDLGYAYAVAGKRDEAQKILGELKRKRKRGFVSSSAFAIVYGALGEKDAAFAWLEKAYEERDPQLTYLKVGPRFDPLRHDPRFKDVLRRIGLADNLPSSNTAN
jgi:TolB-like protein/DNA-binding winged helix-turn-helix (wHTH) protein/Flp pilus assembly protein TadD